MLWSAVYLYSVCRLGIMKRPVLHILHAYALVCCVPVQCISEGIMKRHVLHILAGYALVCCVPVYSVFRLEIMKRPVPHILHVYALVCCVPVQCISVRN